ncbi:hypothetical protein PV325_011794 [Microctonus aethiopoides]|uniref:BPL/LPL catalytic domain-containing protein n=1 Tax=Microctonus aethiopoides TaxID=144406 RepID=A0AA39C8X1_9HYME|nr:hypothetical protein PV325_011794 [Microctonus aethiopoides]KAK0097010.1 hypothetical protein PV326_003608 [Microctonus aethiopoides]KAK0160087.1 hypothetical protein PV328_007530 [Microctonus aethiopoides]
MSIIVRKLTVPNRKLFAILNSSSYNNTLNNFQSTLTNGCNNVNDIDNNKINKTVLISQSNDIYTNLALEDWFYRNYDLKNNHLLLLWRNNPCVVIGRHQNPWSESNSQALEDNSITLARRNSGGGTVYHDAGNLNMSFFTPRERYNRRYNLEIIVRALYREYGLSCNINKREDIVVNDNYKISGTAAKLGRPNAYHHCTLLVDVNKSNLSLALEKKELGIISNATESIRSPVRNLIDVHPHIRSDILLSAIGWEYLRTDARSLIDGGNDLVQQQKGFQMINPTEEWFPGINKLRDEFKSWEWNYGKCPKFTVNRLLKVPLTAITSTKSSTTISSQLSTGKSTLNTNESYRLLNLTIHVNNGIIDDIKMSLPSNLIQDDESNCNIEASVISDIRGTRYNHKVPDEIVTALGYKSVPMDSAQNIHTNNVAATQ